MYLNCVGLHGTLWKMSLGSLLLFSSIYGLDCWRVRGYADALNRIKRALLYQLSYELSPAATRLVAAINSCAPSSLP
jgi:hypothetical protein